LDLFIWGLRSNGVINFKDFEEQFDNFFKVDNKVQSNVFPVFEIPRKLPDRANFSFLHEKWPEYFTTKNKVHLNNSMYEKVKAYIKRYYVETDGKSYPPNPYLDNIYEYEWDFTPHAHTRVLIGESHFESWNRYYKIKKNTGNIINTEIKTEILLQIGSDPYLFKGINTDKIFIIQNVLGKEKERALFLCKYWKDNKFNFGYDGIFIKDEKYSQLDVRMKSWLEFRRRIQVQVPWKIDFIYLQRIQIKSKQKSVAGCVMMNLQIFV
jgi:hypothetical protein